MMGERAKWKSKRKKAMKMAEGLEPRYRASFLKTMVDFGITSTMVHKESGLEVAKGQEERVEKLLKGDFGTVYKRKKKKRK